MSFINSWKKGIFTLFLTLLFSLPVMGSEISEEDSQFLSDLKSELGVSEFTKKDIDEMEDYLNQDDEKVQEELFGGIFKKRPKRVKYDDVKHWSSVGSRYALGHNDKGKAIALYDLSWPRVFSSEHFKRTILGSIGIGNMNVFQAIKMIKDAMKKRKESGLAMAEEDEKKVNKRLRKIEKKYGKMKNVLPNKWWKGIKWKKESLALADTEPVSFKLSDMDLESMAKKPKKWRKKNKKINKKILKHLDLNVSSNLFDHFELVKRKKGPGYDIFFVNDGSHLKAAGNRNLKPKKIGDFVNPYKSFKRSIGLIVVKFAIGQIIGYLPVPVVGDILDVVVSRWFNLMEQQEEAHHFAALENLDLANTGDVNSPFYKLSTDAKSQLGIYLIAQDTAWWKSIFKKASKDDYDEHLVDQADRNAKGMEWLSKKGWTATNLTDWYATAVKDSKKKLFMLNEHYRFSKKPLIGMNYKSPKIELVWRHAAQVIDLAIKYIPFPVQFVDTVLGFLFDYFVNDIIEDGQKEESRFMAYARTRAGTGEDWSGEYSHMIQRRMNPFELDPKETADLVARRKKFLGL